jgi:gamma-glutamyltranspeptidase/glutathione hydrolase
MKRLLLVLALIAPLRAEITARGAKAAAVTVHPLATEAALEAMRHGGNAVDAAIAAGLMLGVVDGHNSGIGGGCFMIVRAPDGTITALDGREMAPAAATRDMFLRDGKADTALSQTGALAAGVPGSLAVYELAAKRFGRLPLADSLTKAADRAAEGFEVSASYAARLMSTAKELGQFPAARDIFLTSDGKPLPKGALLKQVDLAGSYRAVAKEGTRWFYGGDYALKLEQWMKTNGGRLTAEDFRSYKVVEREALRTSYRGREIIGFPPPSSGGVHVAQILNMLAVRPPESVSLNTADGLHYAAEAMKFAFADRAHWLGDPDFAKVPRGLASAEYAKTLAARISMEHAGKVEGHGTPERVHDDVFGKHTTHFSTADAAGWWVACTATVNTTFGSKVVIPGTGIVLNNQMDDFSIQPGVRNAFGLVGAEANAVAPRKRPLSSMSPTLVLQNGRPVLSLGAAGGPTIITQVVCSTARVLGDGLTLDKALASPRLHHQWSPDELRIESAAGPDILTELRRRGHRLATTSGMGACNGIQLLPDGTFLAAGDPRVPGAAGAF